MTKFNEKAKMVGKLFIEGAVSNITTPDTIIASAGVGLQRGVLKGSVKEGVKSTGVTLLGLGVLGGISNVAVTLLTKTEEVTIEVEQSEEEK